MIAQAQGDYAEARRQYGASLEIKERLGDQGGRAITLHQLGMLARQEGDHRAAVAYMFQALAIFERLRSPSRDVVLRNLGNLRSEMGEEAFQSAWQELTGGQAAPPVPVGRDPLLDTLIAFIQAPNWGESRRIVEATPDLLSDEADALLEQLLAAQQDDGARRTIELHRSASGRRLQRALGIVAAFDELRQAAVQAAGRGSRATTKPPGAIRIDERHAPNSCSR